MRSLYSLLSLLLCFAVTAFGTPMPDQLASRATCTLSTMTSAMAALQDGVQYPHQFCSWYISAGRNRSPLQGLSVLVLQNACKCLGYSKPTSTPKATTTMTPGAVTTKCPAANIALLEARYKDTASFCTFFNAAPRDTSPLQVLGVKGVWNACNCILGKASTSSSASSSPTSSDTTVTSSTPVSTAPALTTSSSSSSVSGSPYTVSNSSTAITNLTSTSSSNSSTTSSSTTSTVPSTIFSNPYPTANLECFGIYWGFSSTPAAGSALEVSHTPFGDVFSWSGDISVSGHPGGYMVHADTGLCLTLIAPATTPDSNYGSGAYSGGEVQLQSCDLTVTPPPMQNFAYDWSFDMTDIFTIVADEEYYSITPMDNGAIVVLSTTGVPSQNYGLTYA